MTSLERVCKGGRVIVPKTGVAKFITDLAKRLDVTYVKTNLDELAEVWRRLSDDDVRPDDVELLLIELKRSGVISGKDMGELLVNYLREREQSRGWLDKFEAMSLDEFNVLFATFSDYLLSDAFKRRCGIAPVGNGGARTVKEILFSLAGGELSQSEATSMLGVTDSGHTLSLLAEAGLVMPLSGENESQKDE